MVSPLFPRLDMNSSKEKIDGNFLRTFSVGSKREGRRQGEGEGEREGEGEEKGILRKVACFLHSQCVSTDSYGKLRCASSLYAS